MSQETPAKSSFVTSSEFERKLCGPYTERIHLVELWAQDAASRQSLINGLRRMFGMPIRLSPRQAAAEVRQQFLR